MSASHARSCPPQAPRFAIEVLDIEALRTRAGGDEPFVVELLEDFLGRGDGMPEMLDAAEARDFTLLQARAHRLKGSLLALAATAAGAAAGEVELRAGTLAIAHVVPDARALSALSASLAELSARFAEAADAMRSVMDDATTMTTPVSSR